MVVMKPFGQFVNQVHPTHPTHPTKGTPRRGRNISSSQIEKFQMCQRKWWLDKIAGFKEPYKRHFAYGTALHDAGERFLHGETDLFPEGWAAGLNPEEIDHIKGLVRKAIITGVWSVVPGSYIEYPLCLLVGPRLLDDGGMPLRAKAVVKEDEEGVRFIDRPDCLDDGSPLPPGALDLPYYVGFIDHFIPAEAGAPCIKDHKTAKHRGYAKKERDITESTQLLTYSCIPFSLYPWTDAVIGQYNIFLKDDAAPEPVYSVQAAIYRRQAAARWQTVIQITQMMEQLRRDAPRIGEPAKHKAMGDRTDRAANWKRVPGQVETRDRKIIKESCDAYGGCPYRDLCFGRCTCEQLAYRMDKAI